MMPIPPTPPPYRSGTSKAGVAGCIIAVVLIMAVMYLIFGWNS